MSKVDKVKELLGLGNNTDKEDMTEHQQEIIEEVEEKQ